MYVGQNWYDLNAFRGVSSARRNPKRKKRRPYHAKRNVGNLPVMGEGKCVHALASHETVVDNFSSQAERGVVNTVTVSFALPCIVGHKPTTKNIVHKDSVGRKWK